VGPLEKQSEKAQKFLVLASERKNLEIGIWLDVLEKSADLIREQSNKFTVAEMHYKQTEKELETIIASSEEITETIRKINVFIDELQRKTRETQEQASSVESLIAVNKNSIEHNKATVERIEREKSQENLSTMQIDEQIENTKQSILETEKKIDAAKEETSVFTSQLEGLRARDVNVSDEYVKISDMIASLTNKLSEENIKYTSAKSSLEEIESRKKKLEGI
jgi:chromosome segregation protein